MNENIINNQATMATANEAAAKGGFFSGIEMRSFAIGFGAGVGTAAVVYGSIKLGQMAINHHREKALEQSFEADNQMKSQVNGDVVEANYKDVA